MEKAAAEVAAKKAEAELIFNFDVPGVAASLFGLLDASHAKALEEEAALQAAAKAEAELIVRKFWKFATLMFVDSSAPKGNSGVGSGGQKGGGRTWSLPFFKPAFKKQQPCQSFGGRGCTASSC